jgi:hypothetical protein
MIQITPQMRVLVAIEPIDDRKGIDSIAALCRQRLDADPFSGCVFIFRTRNAVAIKVLVYVTGERSGWPRGDCPKGDSHGGPRAGRPGSWKRTRRCCCWRRGIRRRK